MGNVSPRRENGLHNEKKVYAMTKPRPAVTSSHHLDCMSKKISFIQRRGVEQWSWFLASFQWCVNFEIQLMMVIRKYALEEQIVRIESMLVELCLGLLFLVMMVYRTGCIRRCLTRSILSGGNWGLVILQCSTAGNLKWWDGTMIHYWYYISLLLLTKLQKQNWISIRQTWALKEAVPSHLKYPRTRRYETLLSCRHEVHHCPTVEYSWWQSKWAFQIGKEIFPRNWPENNPRLNVSTGRTPKTTQTVFVQCCLRILMKLTVPMVSWLCLTTQKHTTLTCSNLLTRHGITRKYHLQYQNYECTGQKSAKQSIWTYRVKTLRSATRCLWGGKLRDIVEI